MSPMSAAASGGGDVGTGKDQDPAWQVYCDGPLLKAVQSARLFPDSKTFVDMPMKQARSAALTAFGGTVQLAKLTGAGFKSNFA